MNTEAERESEDAMTEHDLTEAAPGDVRGEMAYTQAVAWYQATQPEAHAEWAARFDAAGRREQQMSYEELTADDYVDERDRLRAEVLDLWRNRPQEGLTQEEARTVDLAHAHGWLLHTDAQHWFAWNHAHGLASTPEERARDEDDLIEVWRTATDEHTPTQQAMEKVGRFGHEYHHQQLYRERLLGRAENWLQAESPERYKEHVEQRTEILAADLPGGPPLDELNQGLLREYRAATGDRPGVDAAPGVEQELAASVGRLQAIRERLRDRIRPPRDAGVDPARPRAQEHADERGWER